MSTYNKYAKSYYEKNKAKISAKRKAERQMKKQQSNSGHTLCSPSSLHRLLVCPASALLCQHVPAEKESSYALEGTLFHAVMEQAIIDMQKSKKTNLEEYAINKFKQLLNETNNDELKETPIEPVIEEMLPHVLSAIEWFDNNIYKNEALIYTELKLPMYYSDVDKGSLDCAVLYHDKLTIIDWKYGKGVDVPVEDNPQLIAYTVSMLKYLSSRNISIKNLTTIETIIYQPRSYHENKIKSCIYTIPELVEKSKSIKNGVNIVYDLLEHHKRNHAIIEANTHTSENGCRFCPAKMYCKKYAKQAEELLDDLTDYLDFNNKYIDIMEDADDLVMLGKKFEEAIPKIEKFYKDLQTFISNIYPLPKGAYMAQKSSRLSYISDTDKVVSVLQSNGIDGIDHSIKLITLTELKKQLKIIENKDEILDEITERKEGSKYITFDSSNADIIVEVGDIS